MLNPGLKKIGLIAGNGKLPVIFAENAKKEGVQVIAAAHIGETVQELEGCVDKILWLKVGKLGKMIDFFKNEGVTDVAMAGGIKKTRIFTDVIPDLRAITLLAKLAYNKDDMILRGIAEEFEKEGFTVRESHIFLSSILCHEGIMNNIKPDKQVMADALFGWEIAKECGKLDIGQCVVVQNKVVLSVEAIEGTDEAIKRGGKLGGGKAVVVKTAKPQQDLRFDLPAVGINTIHIMAENKAVALVLEADKTLIIDKEETLKLAENKNISVIGLKK